MKIVPTSALRGLYCKGSLKAMQNGFNFKVRNKTKGVVLTKVSPIEIDGKLWPVPAVSFVTGNDCKQAESISKTRPWAVPTGDILVRVQGQVLGSGEHRIRLSLEAKLLGQLVLSFSDTVRF